MRELAEIGLCNIHAYSSTVRVFTVWNTSCLWSWCRTCQVITALVMIRFVPWLTFFRYLTLMVQAHNISDLVTSTAWPGALAPFWSEPLWCAWVVSTWSNCWGFRVWVTSVVLKMFIHVSNHTSTEDSARLSPGSTFLWALAPLWRYPGCLTFPIVTSSGPARFLGLKALTRNKGVTSLSSTEHKSTLFSSPTRHWALWPLLARKPFSFTRTCEARFSHGWLWAMSAEAVIDRSILDVCARNNPLFESSLTCDRTLAPFSNSPVCWKRARPQIAVLARVRPLPLWTVAYG